MKSLIVKRSIVVFNHKTSASLEEIFWQHLKFVATLRGVMLHELFEQIENERRHANFSSALRLFVINMVFNYTDDERKAFLESQPPPPAAAVAKLREQTLTRRDWRKISRMARRA